MVETRQIQRSAIPMLSYEDVGEAVDWLVRVFGFRERGERYQNDEGRVTHAELELDGAVVYLGWPGEGYMSPVHHADVCAYAREWSAVPYIVNGVHVTVDDVDAHCERAREGGATILREPKTETYGRLYNAADLEGHRWMFMSATAD
jgi:PhnB protein